MQEPETQPQLFDDSLFRLDDGNDELAKLADGRAGCACPTFTIPMLYAWLTLDSTQGVPQACVKLLPQAPSLGCCNRVTRQSSVDGQSAECLEYCCQSPSTSRYCKSQHVYQIIEQMGWSGWRQMGA